MLLPMLCYALLAGNVESQPLSSAASDPYLLTKRTENEWICPRCRRPAEGHYCARCGQPYQKPKKESLHPS